MSSWTPFWIAQPTATATPVPTLAFTPFYVNLKATKQVEVTNTAWALTIIPTATNTSTYVPQLPFNQLSKGSNPLNLTIFQLFTEDYF